MRFSKLVNSALSILLCFNYSCPLHAETVLEKIKKTGLLKVGIRSDAVPFGYRDNNNELRGICLDFVNLLREELSKKLDRNIITVNILISTLYNRFDIVEDNLVDLECGPNTIREIPEYQVTFSQPFFVTGTQFLVKKDLASKINLNQDLSNLKIAVLRYTTTEELIKNKYPNAQIEYFQGFKGNLRAMQAVQQDKIDAFANDGILLIGEAILLGLPLNEDYQIIPPLPLTCERYGLILPKNDPSWHDFVNSVLDLSKQYIGIQEWFSLLSSDLQKTQQICP